MCNFLGWRSSDGGGFGIASKEEGRKTKEKIHTDHLNICVVGSNIWCPSHFRLFHVYFRSDSSPRQSVQNAGRMLREAPIHRTYNEFDKRLDKVQQAAGDNKGSPGAT